MSTAVLARPVAVVSTTPNDLDHYVCICNTNVALCGADVSDTPWVEVDGELCRFCDDRAAELCPRCGA